MRISTFVLALSLGVTALAMFAAGTAQPAPAALGRAQPALLAVHHAKPSTRKARKRRRVRAVRTASTAPAPPNDPLWSDSWGLRAVGAPGLWRSGQGSPSVVVAVLDTGVDPTQPDLAGALVPGWNAIANDADTTDRYGHGTEVAGVIAGRADNELGGEGYCPRCSIMPVKVMDDSGHGPASSIAAGIDWAVAHGASVINMSLVLTGRDDAVGAAVANAIAHGVLVVAAAGNDGGSAPNYPAAEPGVISVAADDPSTKLYPWSTSGGWVSIAAPGCNETGNIAHGFGEFCGTSSATAAVSGLVGLALSDAAAPDAVRTALLSTAVSTGSVPGVGGSAFLAAVVPQPARS